MIENEMSIKEICDVRVRPFIDKIFKKKGISLDPDGYEPLLTHCFSQMSLKEALSASEKHLIYRLPKSVLN